MAPHKQPKKAFHTAYWLIFGVLGYYSRSFFENNRQTRFIVTWLKWKNWKTVFHQYILRELLNQRSILNTKYWMNFMTLVEAKSPDGNLFCKYLKIRKKLKVHGNFHCIFLGNILSDLGAWSVEYHLQDYKQNEIDLFK